MLKRDFLKGTGMDKLISSADTKIALLPSKKPDDHLDPVTKGRIRCGTLMMSDNEMVVTATGREQTRITYGFTKLMAKYPELTIRSVKTHRSCDENALSFFVLSHINGNPTVLRTFGKELTECPWYRPGGRRIAARAAGKLTVVARDRTQLLRDELEIISAKYDVNIETLVNDHYGPEHFGVLKPVGSVKLGLRDPRFSNKVSVTSMRIEAEYRTVFAQLVADLRDRGEADRLVCGTGWRVEWEERPVEPPVQNFLLGHELYGHEN